MADLDSGATSLGGRVYGPTIASGNIKLYQGDNIMNIINITNSSAAQGILLEQSIPSLLLICSDR